MITKPQRLSTKYPQLVEALVAENGYMTRAQSRKQAAHNTAAPETDAAEPAPKLQDLAQEQYRVREVLNHHALNIRQYDMRNHEFKDEIRGQLADDAEAAKAVKQRIKLLEVLNGKLCASVCRLSQESLAHAHEAKQAQTKLRKQNEFFDAKLDRLQTRYETALRRLQDRYEHHFGHE